jgi:glycosyltransferase involved in cell wall biosynthesis
VKINYVVQRYGRDVVGGAEAACRQLARHIAPHADVTVLTTCALEASTWENHFLPGEEQEDGVRILRFPTLGRRDPGFLRLSCKVFSRPDPPLRLQQEWVRAQGPESPELITSIAARADEPDLWVFYTYLYYPTVLGLPIVGPKALLHPALHDEPAARLPIVREAIRSAAALSLQTHEEWELVLRLAGWPPAMVRLVGMGVEEGTGDVEAFRSRFGLGSDPYVLYLGRVDRGKGTDELAAAFVRCKRRRPDVDGPLKLVMAGPVVHEPPAYADVVVTGRLSDDERWAALEGCAVFAQPSVNESFGLSLLEAWSKAKPALVSAHGPVTSGHVRRAHAGFAYADPVEFEAALEVLLADPSAARRLGRNGRAYAEQYAWPQVAQRYRRFLEEVADAVSVRKALPGRRLAGSQPPHGRRAAR